MIFVDLSRNGKFKDCIVIQHYTDKNLDDILDWCNEHISAQILRFTPDIVGYKTNNYLSKLDPDRTGLPVTKDYQIRNESFLQINFTKADDYLQFRLKWEDNANFTSVDVLWKEDGDNST